MTRDTNEPMGVLTLKLLEFQSTCVSNVFQLNGRLQGGSQLYDHDDPRCRFIFIHSPHSRAHLKLSKEMLDCTFTHHQVMPAFLDFVFPFGDQENMQDFHFSGFREETRLLASDRELSIPALGRSGRDIRLCYNLKSVESSNSNPKMPWSIRQVAVYHSFDVETGKSFWTVIKGNQLLKNRIEAATVLATSGRGILNSFENTASSFSSALATHLAICDWCDEEWRWYLNDLEEKLRNATLNSLAIPIIKKPSPTEEPPRQITKQSSPSVFRQFSNFTKASRKTGSSWTWSSNGNLDMEKQQIQLSFPQPSEPVSTPGRPPPPPKLPPGIPGVIHNENDNDDNRFTFGDLQQVQYLEECANEVFLVLEANVDVLEELREHYQSTIKDDDFPENIKTGCKREFVRFEKRLSSITANLRRQRSRTQNFQRLLGERKSLLYGILKHCGIEASNDLATKSQFSAKRMEAMTEQMHQIAQKTKEETVSMRIITLVTLFFLPGTFISVSLLFEYLLTLRLNTKTIMSTDIIHFQAESNTYGKIFQLGALELYLAITIPLMVVTFAAWYLVYRWLNRRE
ncbi:hypothetical protein LCER1_G003907 [Lachnellula cervina]|uniref:CorA-like transporter domain-containing protein n=1 Tax=Lachnellula cervina TaxID=1316786 RepID=A0A7D8UQR2_9HELO|nr:hypothetical protein LCER1_G003907 [Lachnellula cervina]